MDQDFVAFLELEAGNLTTEQTLAVDNAEDMRTKVSRFEEKVPFELWVLIERRSKRLGNRVPAYVDPIRAHDHLEDGGKVQLHRRGAGIHWTTAAVTE